MGKNSSNRDQEPFLINFDKSKGVYDERQQHIGVSECEDESQLNDQTTRQI
jgi:hypothetical protein